MSSYETPSLLNIAIKVASGTGSGEDSKKIGDFKIDKRLAEFLSLLKPDFNEDQLRGVVYLSRLTPAQDVSVLPSDILRRIAEMAEEELSTQIARLSEDGVLSLADRAIDRLLHIQTYSGYKENLKLYDLLNLLFKGAKEESSKTEMFDKIFRFMLTDGLANIYFLPKLETYTSLQVVRKWVLERELLDQIIALFVQSNSYEEAKQNSATLLNFNEDLTPKQIETIVEASIENDQIYPSWGAQKNLREIFSRHREEISEERRKKIKSLLKVSL